MATVTIKLRPHRRLGLNTTPAIRAAQASAATFVQGAPVKFTSGYIAACAVTSTNSHSNVDVSAGMLGIADEAAAASSTSDVCVTPALPGMMFRGMLIDSGASSNAGALATIAQTHLGATAAITQLASDTHYGIDVGTSAVAAEPCAKIVELIDAVGSTGEVGVIILQTGRALDVVAS